MKRYILKYDLAKMNPSFSTSLQSWSRSKLLTITLVLLVLHGLAFFLGVFMAPNMFHESKVPGTVSEIIFFIHEIAFLNFFQVQKLIFVHFWNFKKWILILICTKKGKNCEHKRSENDLKISDHIRSDQIRSFFQNAIWSDLRSLFKQMILIWS